MRRRPKEGFTGPIQGWAGWLFADMLLALAIFFLITNTLEIPKPPLPQPTPKPTTGVSQGTIESNYCQITLSVTDPVRFSLDLQYAINILEPELKQQAILQGRQVGLAIALGGSPDNTQANVDQARAIAEQVYKVLQNLGNKEMIFRSASYFDPLFDLGNPASIVWIDVYLIIQKGRVGETCNSTTHKPA